MPETTDLGAEHTVAIVEDEFEVPTEDQLQDAQASAQLSVLFIEYLKLKRARPKLPAESKVMPALAFDPESIDTMVAESVQKFSEWVSDCGTLLFTIHDIGQSNPGANIHIVGRDGRSVQTNGTKLYEALLRTESQILGGKLASAG